MKINEAMNIKLLNLKSEVCQSPRGEAECVDQLKDGYKKQN